MVHLLDNVFSAVFALVLLAACSSLCLHLSLLSSSIFSALFTYIKAELLFTYFCIIFSAACMSLLILDNSASLSLSFFFLSVLCFIKSHSRLSFILIKSPSWFKIPLCLTFWFLSYNPRDFLSSFASLLV